MPRLSAGPEPRHFANGVFVAGSSGVGASRDEGRDGRPGVPTGSTASRERRGHVVKRPHEPHFLLARQPAPERRCARLPAWPTVSVDDARNSVRGQSIPGGAEHLKRILQRREGLGSVHMASSSFGSAMERVGGLDQCGCGVLPGVLGGHGDDGAAGAVSDHGSQPPISRPRLPIGASRGAREPRARAGSHTGSTRRGCACRASRACWRGGGRPSSC
jgi:hypothetical protein